MKTISRMRDSIRLFFNRRRYDFVNSRRPEELSFERIRHVVVSKMDGKLGDSQVMTPFFTELRRCFPHIKLSVLCSANVEPIYHDCLKLDQVLRVSKRPSKDELDAAVQQLNNAGPCDLLVTLEGYFRFRDFYLVNQLRPQFVAGIADNICCININLAKRNQNCHITQYFTDLLQLGGIIKPSIRYMPLISDDSLTKARHYCRSPQIAFAPWGASVHKHISDEVIKDLVKLISASIPANIALLVPSEGNYLHTVIKDILPASKVIAVPEHMNCLELASIIHLSDALISVDTGNLHLACASQKPLFAIYNGNNDGLNVRWAPLSVNSLTVKYSKSGFMIDQLKTEDLLGPVQNFLMQLQGNFQEQVNYD